MRAMLLRRPGEPLESAEVPVPAPARGQVQIEVAVCAVCRTDLHVVDGELPEAKLPLVPGHQIVGRVREVGSGVTGLGVGDGVGVAGVGGRCGRWP